MTTVANRIQRLMHMTMRLFLSLGVVVLTPYRGEGAEFSCGTGDTACLISAITTANSNSEADTIKLAAGAYTLTSINNTTDEANGLPSISSPIAIVGAGVTTIIERAAGAPLFRLFHVAATGTLQLTGLTLSNGGDGRDLEICFALPGPQFRGNGAGIFNAGSLTLASVIIKNNTTRTSGGGLYNTGTAVVTNTTVGDNCAAFRGGGGLTNAGTATITNSAIVRNIAGGAGGILNRGPLMLTNVTLAHNSGVGAIGFPDDPSPLGTGALENHADTVLLINTTVVGNRSSAGDDFSDGIAQLGTGRIELLNTIVAGNLQRVGECYGSPIISLGHNVLGSSCENITRSASDLGTTDPRLGNLVDNGQPGRAYTPVLPGSPAIDSSENAFCQAADQLGRARADGNADGSVVCDSGAAEFRPGEVIPAPDLIESTVYLPPNSALRGSSFVARDIVRNIGTTAAGNSETRYYLSRNNVKDDGDVLLTGQRFVPPLAAGAISDGTATVTIPPTTLPATYYFFACTDDGDTFGISGPLHGNVSESNENNNCQFANGLIIVR